MVVFVLVVKDLKELFLITKWQNFDGKQRLYHKGELFSGCYLITTYIQQYVDMTVGLKNDEDHHGVGG